MEPGDMQYSEVGQDLIVRTDESRQSLIDKMISETPYIAPSVSSFAIGELSEEDTRSWTYSSNGA
jgi:hypothetical protein